MGLRKQAKNIKFLQPRLTYGQDPSQRQSKPEEEKQ